MPIPEQIRLSAEKVLDEYCRNAVPKHAHDKLRLGYLSRGMAITLFEMRPSFRRPTKWTSTDVARFRYNKASKEWMLYWRDRNSKWHIYEGFEPSADFSVILQEVLDDPTGIFWG